MLLATSTLLTQEGSGRWQTCVALLEAAQRRGAFLSRAGGDGGLYIRRVNINKDYFES